ncbi:MAG TPA: M23 family metallopeptidase [Blastocatellia bacterium]|nr:M23 family metallopeptidase [Blastocatellia bacterium]
MADVSRKWHRLVRGSFFLAGVLLLFVLVTIRMNFDRAKELARENATPKSEPRATSLPSPTVIPTIAYTPEPSPSPSPAPTDVPPSPNDAAASLPYRLIIPVADVRPEQLRDTFTESRSEGRRHDAIDIIAPRGAAVLAAADGKIARLFNSEKGGITLYQLSPDQQFVFYYAHLNAYADGVKDGKPVKQGEVIAYVGDTGNAIPGNTHLHFAVWRISDPKKFWDGENINPFSLLRNSK